MIPERALDHVHGQKTANFSYTTQKITNVDTDSSK